MRHLRFASWLSLMLAAATLPNAAVAQTAKPTDAPRALLELFTSQGCSSCPPADLLLGEMAGDPSIVAVTLAVDYWDYLGWKDTMALSGNTARQRAYAHARGDREVYTPQMVVNGLVHVLGSDRTAIDGAIRQTRQTGAPLAVPVTIVQGADALTVRLPASATADSGSAEVWICPTSRAVAVKINRGENRGRSINYTNVVRRWVKAGDWSGKAETFSVPLASLRGAGVDMVTVLVQRGGANGPRVVLGAAQGPLP